MDGLIYDLSDEERPETFSLKESDLYELTLAMSELALVLSEQTLGNADQRNQKLKEAGDFWEQSEKIRPGSSRYARARWSAHLGDLEGVKKNLAHNLTDHRALLFPALAEAREDPALAAYINEPWFEKCWYGFE